MASQKLDILVQIKGGADKSLRQLSTNLKGLKSPAGIASKAISLITKNLFSLRGAIAGLGVGFLAKNFLDAARATEKYRTQLKGVLGSAKEGAKMFESMSQLAARVPKSFDEIMRSAANLAGVMKGGREEVEQWMPVVVDIASRWNLSMDEASSNFVRAYSAGIGAADLFRDKGISAAMEFQAGVSYSADETRKKLMSAWLDPASKFRGAANDLAKTWDGAMSMLGDAWFQFRNAVMESGVFDYLKSGLKLILDQVDRFKKSGAFKEFAQTVSDTVIRALEWLIIAIGDVIDQIVKLKPEFLRLKAAMLEVWSVVKHMLPDIKTLGTVLGIYFAGGLKNVRRSMRQTANELIKSNMFFKQHAKSVGDDSKALLDEAAAARAAADGMAQTAGARRSGIALVQRLREEMAKLRIERKKELEDSGRQPQTEEFQPGPYVTTEDLEIEAKHARTIASTVDQAFQDAYASGEISLQRMFEKRRTQFEYQFALEKELIEAKLAEENSPETHQALLDQLYVVEQGHQQRLTQLHGEESAKRKAFLDSVASAANQSFGDMASAFGDMYQLMGNKSKEFMIAWKAMQIAQTVINTIVAAQNAYTRGTELAGSGVAGIGLGIAMAAAATAAGMARVAMISSQSFGGGGEVGGHSPHAKADNIRANLTAGEFVEPVAAVKHYGVNLFESLRQMRIPKSAFEGFNFAMPNYRRGSSHFAEGGSVTRGPMPTMSTGDDGKPINIINVSDPAEFERFASSKPGERAILNVLSRNPYVVRKIVGRQ